MTEPPARRGSTSSRLLLDLERTETSLEYAREWRFNLNLVAKFRDLVFSAENASPRIDYLIAASVGSILETAILKDRDNGFQIELKELVEKINKNGLTEDETQKCFKLLYASYGLNEREVQLQLRNFQLIQAGMLGTPRREFMPDFHRNSTCARFYHLTLLELPGKKAGVEARLKGVYDGGIDSLAYPFKDLSIRITPEAGITVTPTILYWRRNELQAELVHHPEINEFIKQELLRIFDLYANDMENFIDKRQPDGDKDDPTQVEGSLLTFIDQYLAEKLPAQNYLEYSRSLAYIETDGVAAALGLRVIVEELLPEKAYVRVGWFSKNDPQVLHRILNNALNSLTFLGYVVKEAQDLPDASEIIQRAITDPKFATAANQLWRSIFAVPDDGKIVASMIRDDLDVWVRIYKYDLEMKVYQKALEFARTHPLLPTETP